MQIQKNKSILVLIWAVVLAFLVSVVSLRSILSTPLSIDSYTHIAIGQYVITQKKIPSHQDISFKQTEPSLEWISHSWFSDVLLYMAQLPHIHFGIWIIIIPMLLFSTYITSLLLQTVTTKRLAYISLCLPILCALNFWRYHPFLFIVPLHLILMLLLHHGIHRPKFFLAIPLVFLLWANVSGGTISIPALYLLVFFFIRPNKYLAIVMPVSILATFINPYGIRLWGYLFTTLAIVHQNKLFSSLTGAVTTINQTYNKQQFSSIYLVVFSLYILIFVGSLLSRVFKNPRSMQSVLPLLPSLLFLPLAFFWVRFIPLTVFATLPLFVWCIEEGLTRMSKRSRTRLSSIVMTTSILGILWLLVRPPILAAPKIPTDHISRIQNFSLSPNILTTYDFTGYSMYSLPEYKVMLDAQDDLLNDEFLISYYQPIGNFSQNFESVSTTLSVQTALVSRDIGGLSSTLSALPDWNLLYIDYDAALFAKISSMDEAFFQKNTLHSLQLNTNLGYDPDKSGSAAAELEIFTARYPENTLLLGQLATIYRINKTFDRAEKTMQRIPKNRWNFSLFTEYGRLKAAKGQCIDAETNFLRALSFRNEKNYSRTVLDLAVLYAGCFKDTKRAKHYFIRYNSFLITTSEREKLHMLTKQFGINMNQ